MNFSEVIYIIIGIKYTIIFSIISMFLGFFIGFFCGFCRFLYKNTIFEKILKIYSSIFRNTPIIFQLFVSLFIININLPINGNISFVLVLSLNSGAYMSEVFFDSMNNIENNYIETALGLGFSKSNAIIFLLLDKIFFNISNTLKNEIVSLTKETSIASFIGISDIFFRAKEVSALNYEFLGPVLVSGVIFFILNQLYEKVLSNKIIYLVKKIIKLVYVF